MKPTALERRIFGHATSALLGGPVAPARTDEFLVDFGARAPVQVAWGLRLLLWLVLVSPFLLAGRLRSFLAVPLEEGAELWTRALEHRSYTVRQLALVVKALACLCEFDRERA